MTRTFFLPLSCLLVLSLAPPGESICPVMCTCSGGADEEVDCSSQGLEALPLALHRNITKLVMAGNRLTMISNDTFARFRRLSTIDLSNNTISNMSSGAFTAVSTITYLSLYGNQLTALPNGIFENLENLNLLDLRYNKLSELEVSILDNCFALAQLKLGHNIFTSEVFKALGKVPWIRYLDLSGNPLNSLPYLAMGNLHRLSILELNDNSLQTVDINAFVGLQELQFLHLARNDLREIRREMFQTMIKLVEIDLESNPITCSCGTKQFKDWLQESGVVLQPRVSCQVEAGSRQIDIASGDLDFLCFDSGLTTARPITFPPGVCENITAPFTIKQNETKGLVFVHWDASNFPSADILQITLRAFSKPNPFFKRLIPSQNGVVYVEVSPEYARLGTVICLDSRMCDLNICQEIMPESSPSTVNYMVAVIVGSVLGVCIFILIVILVWTVLQMKRQQNKNNNAKQNMNGTPPTAANQERRPTAVSTGLGDDPYEAIPAERMDPRKSLVPANSAFTNRGYDEKFSQIGQPGWQAPPKPPLNPDQYLHTSATMPTVRKQTRPTTTELLDATSQHPEVRHPRTGNRRPSSEHNYEEPVTGWRSRATTDYEQPLPRLPPLPEKASPLHKSYPTLENNFFPNGNTNPAYDGSNSEYTNMEVDESAALQRYTVMSDLTNTDSEYIRMSSRTPSEYMEMGTKC